jgi:hypothetical protein
MADRPKPSSTERGECSSTRREIQQRNEKPQGRIERVRRENTRIYISENRRENENPEQRDKRLYAEREGLREKLKSARNNSEEQDIAHQWQKDYMQREKNCQRIRKCRLSSL